MVFDPVMTSGVCGAGQAFIPDGFKASTAKTGSGVAGYCKQCRDNCKSCQFDAAAGMKCVTCADGFSLSNNACLKGTQQALCTLPANCSKCYLDTAGNSLCSDCSANFKLVNGLCRAKCTDVQYVGSDGSCKDCASVNCKAGCYLMATTGNTQPNCD